jgi:hypothetical protein
MGNLPAERIEKNREFLGRLWRLENEDRPGFFTVFSPPPAAIRCGRCGDCRRATHLRHELFATTEFGILSSEKQILKGIKNAKKEFSL